MSKHVTVVLILGFDRSLMVIEWHALRCLKGMNSMLRYGNTKTPLEKKGNASKRGNGPAVGLGVAKNTRTKSFRKKIANRIKVLV